jgi:hypothetical protein
MVTQNHTSMMTPTKPKQWKPKPAAEGVPSLFAASVSSKPLKIVKKTATPNTTTSAPPRKSVPVFFQSAASTRKPVKEVTTARPVTLPSSKRHEAPKSTFRKPSPVVIEKPKPVVVDEPKYYSPKRPRDVVDWKKPKPKQVMDKSKPQPVLVARPKFYDEKPRPRGSELEPQEYDENKPVRWSQIPLALETFILQRENKPITTEVSDVLKILRNAEEDADSVSSHEDIGKEDNYHHDKMQDKLSHFMSGHSAGSVSSGSSVASDYLEDQKLFRYGKEFDDSDSD